MWHISRNISLCWPCTRRIGTRETVHFICESNRLRQFYNTWTTIQADTKNHHRCTNGCCWKVWWVYTKPLSYFFLPFSIFHCLSFHCFYCCLCFLSFHFRRWFYVFDNVSLLFFIHDENRTLYNIITIWFSTSGQLFSIYINSN